MKTRLQDLNKSEWAAAANHFGFEVGETTAETRLNAEQAGVTWKMYQEAFYPEEEPKPAPAENVITAGKVTQKVDLDDTVITAPEPPKFEEASKYLIKMDRANPLFEFGRYRFTQENPFVIMPAEDAQRILTQEKGFRQAFPSEAQDFYS